VNHAYISDTTFVSQIIGKNTFSEGFPVKFPTNSLFVSVYLNLDNSQLSFGCRLTHNPPWSCLLFFDSFCVMNFSIGKVETDRFITNFVLNRTEILWHDSELDAVKLRINYFESKSVFSFFRKNLVWFDAMPRTVSSNFYNFVVSTFIKLGKLINYFVLRNMQSYSRNWFF